jgi:hypothetical protein
MKLLFSDDCLYFVNSESMEVEIQEIKQLLKELVLSQKETDNKFKETDSKFKGNG